MEKHQAVVLFRLGQGSSQSQLSLGFLLSDSGCLVRLLSSSRLTRLPSGGDRFRGLLLSGRLLSSARDGQEEEWNQKAGQSGFGSTSGTKHGARSSWTKSDGSI
jgi:hypothetical protein